MTSKAETASVLVLTPARQAAGHVDRYFELLDRIEHPPELLSVGLLEGTAPTARSRCWSRAWRSCARGIDASRWPAGARDSRFPAARRDGRLRFRSPGGPFSPRCATAS